MSDIKQSDVKIKDIIDFNESYISLLRDILKTNQQIVAETKQNTANDRKRVLLLKRENMEITSEINTKLQFNLYFKDHAGRDV